MATCLTQASDVNDLLKAMKPFKAGTFRQRTAAAGGGWEAQPVGKAPDASGAVAYEPVDVSALKTVKDQLTISDFNLVEDMIAHNEGSDIRNAQCRAIITNPSTIHPIVLHPRTKTWFDDDGMELLIQPPKESDIIHVAQRLEARQIAKANTAHDEAETQLLWLQGSAAAPNFYPYSDANLYAADVRQFYNEFGGEPEKNANGRRMGTPAPGTRIDSRGAVVGGQSLTVPSEETRVAGTRGGDDDYYDYYGDDAYEGDYEYDDDMYGSYSGSEASSDYSGGGRYYGDYDSYDY